MDQNIRLPWAELSWPPSSPCSLSPSPALSLSCAYALPVPQGRPLPGVRVLVVEDAVTLRPAPPGVEGELLIGGPCVARGYVSPPSRPGEEVMPGPESCPAHVRFCTTPVSSR